MRNGKFITIEGISGCGRTAQLHELAEHLISNGRMVLLLREPLCASTSKRKNQLAGQDIAVIESALKSGCIVLAEGFFDCEATWQNELPDVGFQQLSAWKKQTKISLKPDLSFVLGLEVGTALARDPQHQPALAKLAVNTWLNSEVFYEKTQASWLELMTLADWPVQLISAEQHTAVIQRQIINRTQQLLEKVERHAPSVFALRHAKKRTSARTSAKKLLKLSPQTTA